MEPPPPERVGVLRRRITPQEDVALAFVTLSFQRIIVTVTRKF